MKDLNLFFNPKSIAIVGASPKNEKLGNILARNILDGGWRGKLYFVNPKHKNIGARRCFASLNEIKKPVDLVLVAIPAPRVNAVLEEGAISKPKIENFVVISAGFKETGRSGKRFEDELKNIAMRHKLNILGPNCLGFINTSESLNATFTDARIKEGKIAVVSQSGALEVALLDWAEENKAGFSKAISIGNKAVLGESDILRYLFRDKDTNAIALYLEDVKNGADFVSAIAGFNCKKPIAVIKAGKSKAGQKAITSHTGSLAQDESIIKAVFEKYGIIQPHSVEEFQDIISYLEFNKIPKSNEIIIITNAGGLGVLSADFVGADKKLKLLSFSRNLKKSLRSVLPPGASAENPIDILGDAPPERYKAVLEILSQNLKNYSFLILLTPQNQSNPTVVAKILGRYRKKIGSMSTSFVGGTKIKPALQELDRLKIPNFESPERALMALQEAMGQNSCRRVVFSTAGKQSARSKPKGSQIIKKAIAEKRKMLFWQETENIFREYGISLAKSVCAKSLKEACLKKLKFPCVLKTDDPQIAHRWEKKAVALDIKNSRELKNAWNKIKKTTGAGNFLIQPMAESGLEIIVGMKRDPTFGPVVLVGSGGTFTEIDKDRVILIPPFFEKDVIESMFNLRIFPILKGFRGEKGYKFGEIAKIASAVKDIAVENPEISQIDINPAMIYNDGKSYQILDAKIYL